MSQSSFDKSKLRSRGSIKSSGKYNHIQPKISSFRASSRNKFSREEQGSVTDLGSTTSRPKIPLSKIKPIASTKGNKDTFVMQTSRNSISNANINFEYLKNNFMKRQTSRSRPGSNRGSIQEENKRNAVMTSGQYKTNLSGINKSSRVASGVLRTETGESSTML